MPAPKGHPPYPGCERGGVAKVYTPEFIEKEAEILEAWTEKYKDSVNLFIEDFAYERGYDDRRVYEWKDQNEKFALAYKRFHNKQKTMMIKGGLTGKIKHNMCALILANSHGIYAKSDSEKTTEIAIAAATYISNEIKKREKVNE